MAVENDLLIKDIIKYLNPNKLSVFKININNELCLDGLDIIKKEFNRLKVIHLMASIIYSNYDKLSPDISFPSKLDLEISGGINFNIKELGNLKQLKSITLMDYYSVLLSVNDDVEYDITNLEENSNIHTLGYFSSCIKINNTFSKPSSLKEVYISKLSTEIISSISLIPNIRILRSHKLDLSVKKIYKKLSLNSDELNKKEHNLLQCNYI